MYDRLSDFIHARGIARQQLAIDSKVALSTLDRLLAGHGQARKETVKKLATTLRVTKKKILKMLDRERRMRQKPEALGDICRATAICRAAAKGATVIDRATLIPYLRDLERTAKKALNLMAGNESVEASSRQREEVLSSVADT